MPKRNREEEKDPFWEALEKDMKLSQPLDQERKAKMTSTLQEPKSEFLSIADTYDGKKLNSPKHY